ncbi:AraC family transcriptional regulator [Bradyrhizobium sp. KBS0727]|uniref:helix-turn-helix domain-containing protein n=1 Tax=unclassified Bradyrhizobium TaxID=2631580 RepID=UPI00110D9CBE|nr:MULTISPECIES: AraC family transcriptional regulator [unclassified Bradyrhizobium]QDW40531.1 AraC family transcriptional regulator [Bradyrhizobium sp. KBS0725]QDW47136.1 AraC family transcriptional regulator [Bradyrhizobium sp. KBS0727]
MSRTVELKSSADGQSLFVPISEAYSYSDGAVMRGLSRDELFKQSLLDPHIQTHISLGQIVLLLMNTIDETDDHFSGLGRHTYPPSQLILMLRIMMACSTLERAIGSLAHFCKMGQPISIWLRTDGMEARLCVSCDDAFGGQNAPVIEDICLNAIFGGLCYFLGRRFPASAIVTRNRRQALGVRHWSMSAAVHLGAVAAIHFPVSLLTETRQADPTDDICWAILQHRLALDSGINPHLPIHSVSIKQLNASALCAELGISPATFRRRNSVAGGQFRRFREETLVEASLSLLADDARSVSSIAADLGYADVRSYRRFIKGATGSTPDQLRANSAAAKMRALEPEVVARIKEIATRLSS